MMVQGRSTMNGLSCCMTDAGNIMFLSRFLEREMFLSRTEKSITSARLINTFRRCAPGCNILPLNRTAPFKHAAVPASGEIHVMDAGGAENGKVRKRPPEKEMERKGFMIGSDNNKKRFR